MSSLPRKIRPIALNVQQQTDCPTSIVMMSSRVRALRRIGRIPEPDKNRLFSARTYSADGAMREEQNLPEAAERLDVVLGTCCNAKKSVSLSRKPEYTSRHIESAGHSDFADFLS